MINKVTFTGREEMLVKPVEELMEKVEPYINAATILPALPQEVVKKVPAAETFFISPYAPLGEKIGNLLDKIV